MPRNFNLGWHGMLTTQNVEQVVDLLRQLLEGKRYTWVEVYEFSGYRPHVRTGQRVAPEDAKSQNPFSVHHHSELGYSGFNVVDTYGLWGCSTNLHEDTADREQRDKNPHLSFEHNKVTINGRTPEGKKFCWVVAVEEDD